MEAMYEKAIVEMGKALGLEHTSILVMVNLGILYNN